MTRQKQSEKHNSILHGFSVAHVHLKSSLHYAISKCFNGSYSYEKVGYCHTTGVPISLIAKVTLWANCLDRVKLI